ncbi:MAG: gamma-glutamyltransferase [Deltaproteobacteria bacterium]|jgi:gamma-glutamyltranspeptidase / glutathione hydrolase|nr:gamma-glutamyltransferase [Deltaproteobacteria bacterium]MBT4263502.1 gamma-glutamyltransferase [Deltaproteobacteria bacterium]MBT4640748.1 gamma-glutamyltransferase [Deltaproteobacteria bacterium]MBT6500042.1 gamma-glutamyltransferase [Deltaproteobacteria bacterium]MBT6610701.1 gamma-glutamyltransferase [Deltaproteobacteria bacterium]
MKIYFQKLSFCLLCWFMTVMASGFIIETSAQAIIEGERAVPAEAKNGIVVTSHYLATTEALQVLKKGGNAVDAAVTAAFALAVTQPRSGNIGGGGFMLISMQNTGSVIAIDYREKAPAAASKNMFLDDKGDVDKFLSRFSHRAAGVPGTVAGLAVALEKFGTLSLAEALQPAIRLAREGFIVTPRFSRGVKSRSLVLKKWASSRKTFFKKDGSNYKPGDRFRQPDLAATLQRIEKSGQAGFYEGQTAALIVAEMEKNQGLITAADLRNYRPLIRKPVHGTYRGFDIYSMSPPSSGGIHIIQILNILEHYPIASMGHNSAKTIHLMAEAMKYAYADRARYLGDTDFVKVPVQGLIAKGYARRIKDQIDPFKPRSSRDIHHGEPSGYESGETTHFSIVDRFGNAVSNTYTINFSYGSGIVVEGAGFLLNNEMDDFSAKPGVPNAYGLIGGESNRIQPGKRMLSSMSPTIVKKQGKNMLVVGSPGGSRIITTTLQVIMNVVDHGLNIQSAVNAPRIHHQWFPDEIRVEEGISPDTVLLLRQMGHTVKQKRAMGAIQGILIDDNGNLYGGADPRRSTSSAMGH